MPYTDGIIVNQVTINENCSICHRDLSDISSINVSYAFTITRVCTSCLQEIFTSYPAIKQAHDDLNELFSELNGRVAELEKKPAEKAQTIAKATVTKKTVPVPAVQKEDKVRTAGK